MSILFIISFILFIYSFLRIKKTNNKLNILLWIFISIITFMGYNSIIIYLLSTLKIHSTLLIKSLINILLSIIMIIISKKKKQKYYFDIKDLIITATLLYLSLIIFMFRFGFSFNLEFKMNDAAAHFAMAKAYMTNNIYDSTMTNIFYNISDKEMFFSSTNLGTFLDIIKPITGEMELYKGFILFEILSFFLSGQLLYFIIRNNKYNIKNYILTIILLILYQLGYPLLNLLYGFHYWGLIILVINTIIITIKEMTNNKMYNCIPIIIMLFIQSISVFITYYLYVPVIYGALGLYILYLWKYKKELTKKRSIIYIIIILIIPFCFGFLFFDIFKEYFCNFGPNTKMGNEGANYKNLIGNFIYLLPLLLYSIINEIKNKKITLITIITILNILFMIVLFILCIKGIMSNYYFGKIYNLLWLITFIYLIDTINNNKEGFIKFYLYSYIIISILACFRIENIIDKYKNNISNDTAIKNIGNVYDANIKTLQNRKWLIDNNTLEILKEVKKHESEYKNKRGEIPFITNYFKKIWIAQILDVIPSNNYDNEIYKTTKLKAQTMRVNDINEVKNDDDVIYFVWFPDNHNINGVNIDDYTIIYKNKTGLILKKK